MSFLNSSFFLLFTHRVLMFFILFFGPTKYEKYFVMLLKNISLTSCKKEENKADDCAYVDVRASSETLAVSFFFGVGEIQSTLTLKGQYYVDSNQLRQVSHMNTKKK